MTFKKENSDAFLDAYLKLSIFHWAWRLVSIEEIIQFTIYDKVTWLWWLLQSFSGLLVFTYFILTIYAFKYFKRMNFDKRTLLTPRIYLGTVTIMLLLATATLFIPRNFAESAPLLIVPRWAGMLIVIAINGVLAFLLFYNISLRKNIQPKLAVTQRATKTTWVTIALLAFGAMAFATQHLPLVVGVKKTTMDYIVGFISILVPIGTVWYALKQMITLRVPTKSLRSR